MYLKHSEGVIVPLPAMTSVETVPPGIYNIRFVEINGGKSLGLQDISSSIARESIIRIENEIFKLVIDYADQFQTKADLYDEFGFSHRSGILLYGKEGTGKTVLAKTVALRLVDNGYIVIYLRDLDDLRYSPNMIRWIRHTDAMKNQKFCIVMDEFEGYTSKDEQSVLKFLDGDDSEDGVLSICITNYKSALALRMLRPSRFGLIREIPMLDQGVIRQYVTSKLSNLIDKGYLTKEDMYKFLADLDTGNAYTIDQVKDMMIKRFILGDKFTHSDFDMSTHKVI